ncbi:MAG: hypothetical protein F6K39_23050 [Okeania sp. SIO3B3]|nr:hypothetical protein [Okeania sp. SIO3B3]
MKYISGLDSLKYTHSAGTKNGKSTCLPFPAKASGYWTFYTIILTLLDGYFASTNHGFCQLTTKSPYQ